jgi:hypothetical protein
MAEYINGVDRPFCTRCGMAMRLISVEPHLGAARADIRMFRCSACDAQQTLFVPSANAPTPPLASSTEG